MKHSLDQREFKQLFSSYKSLAIGDLLFRYKKNNTSKLGLIVSRKYGNAVKRNLFKRRCRELFKKHFINEMLHLVVQPKSPLINWNQLNNYFSEFKLKTNG